MSIVPHLEAGSYCCGFIYYESLATCWKRGLNTKVIFTHVPGWRDPERLGRGADVICAIIGSACKQIKVRALSK
jgi:pyroglutamyl-peptidase